MVLHWKKNKHKIVRNQLKKNKLWLFKTKDLNQIFSHRKEFRTFYDFGFGSEYEYFSGCQIFPNLDPLIPSISKYIRSALEVCQRQKSTFGDKCFSSFSFFFIILGCTQWWGKTRWDMIWNITWRLFCQYTNRTVCPGSSDPFYVVTIYIKWVTTSWTYSTSI